MKSENGDGEGNHFDLEEIGRILENINGELVNIGPCKEFSGTIPLANFESNIYVKNGTENLCLASKNKKEELNIQLHIDSNNVAEIKLHNNENDNDCTNVFVEFVLNSGNIIQIIYES